MIKDNDIAPGLLEEDDRIDSFLKGKMTEQEEQQFLKDLNENHELKEKAIATARLVKGLKQVGSQQDRDIVNAFLASSERSVKAAAKEATRIEVAESVVNDSTEDRMETDLETNIQKTAKIMSMRKAATWLSIAASVIFIVWVGLEHNSYRHTTGLGQEYGEVFSHEIINRGANTPSASEKKLEKLFGDVKDNNNIDEAIRELSLCWEISLMETYNDYTEYSAEIGWNLAIAHLKDNDKKSAKNVLQKLVETTDEGSAVNQKAKELLSKI